MTNQVSVYQKFADPLEAIKQLGTAIAKSGMFGVKNFEAGHVLAMTCFSERKSPTEIARRYHIIDGKLSMKAGAMLADFKLRGNKYKIIERTPNRAAIEMTNEFQSHVFELTWEEAQLEPFVYGKSKQIKDNYATPRIRMQMLWARVVSDGVEVMAPEISYGVYTPEEISDFPELSNNSITISDDGGNAEFSNSQSGEVVDAVFELATESESLQSEEVESSSPAEPVSPLDEPVAKEVLLQIRSDVQFIESVEPGFALKFSESLKQKTGGRNLGQLTNLECIEISNVLKKKASGLGQR